MKKLRIEDFKNSSLKENQLRALVGGGQNTTWTGSNGSSGEDTCTGGSNTSFSDGTTSGEDYRTCGHQAAPPEATY